MRALTAEEAATLLARAREEYDDARYDHVAWFFGNDELGIPRWAGYTLGFKLVADYLERNPTATASTLTTTRLRRCACRAEQGIGSATVAAVRTRPAHGVLPLPVNVGSKPQRRVAQIAAVNP